MDLSQSENHGMDKATIEWLHTGASTSPSSLDQSFEHDGIATQLHAQSIDIFRRIYRIKRHTCPSDKSFSKVKEELGKFYLWGNAFADGELDRALESSDDVRFEVLDSLSAIARLLLRVWHSQTYSDQAICAQRSTHELESLTVQAKIITAPKDDLEGKKQSSYEDYSDTEEDSSDEDDGDEPGNGEGDRLFGEIGLHIKWLTQLSPTLERNPISLPKAQATKVALCNPKFLVSTPAQYYVSLVRERYKLADERLVERLGEANWQRYLDVRHSPWLLETTNEEDTRLPNDRPAADSVFRPYSTFHDSGIGTSVNHHPEDARSHTSFLSTDSKSGFEAARVPATPVEVQAGIPFRCFLCKRTLSNIKTRVDWRMHIFSDLRPYICTFTRCQEELVQFDRRSDWADHEFKKHRVRKFWNCVGCSERLSAVEEWEDHLQKVHDIRFTGRNLQAARRLALIEEEQPAEQEECPLCCKVVNKSRRGFIAHVGHHMEQIALIVLPRDVDDTESNSCSSSIEHITVEESRNPVKINTEKASKKERRKVDEAEEEMTLPTNCDQAGTGSFKDPMNMPLPTLSTTMSSESPSSKHCPVCGKYFGTRWNLNRHIRRRHSRTAPFLCAVIDCIYHEIGFPHQDELHEHVRKVHYDLLKSAPVGTVLETQIRPEELKANVEHSQSIVLDHTRVGTVPQEGEEGSHRAGILTGLGESLENPLEQTISPQIEKRSDGSAEQPSQEAQIFDKKHRNDPYKEEKLKINARGMSGEETQVLEFGTDPPKGAKAWLCGRCKEATMPSRDWHCTHCQQIREYGAQWFR